MVGPVRTSARQEWRCACVIIHFGFGDERDECDARTGPDQPLCWNCEHHHTAAILAREGARLVPIAEVLAERLAGR